MKALVQLSGLLATSVALIGIQSSHMQVELRYRTVCSCRCKYVSVHVQYIRTPACVEAVYTFVHLLIKEEGKNLCWSGRRIVSQVVCCPPGNMRRGHGCTRDGIECTSRPGGCNAAALHRETNELGHFQPQAKDFIISAILRAVLNSQEPRCPHIFHNWRSS